MRPLLGRRPRLRLERLEARLAPSFGAVGPEFRVNSYTTDNQSAPAVASDADGDFVIAWASNGQDGSNYGVYAQQYSSAGAPRGGEFRVNSSTTGHQSGPAVAMSAAGDFVVAWNSEGQDGSNFGVYAQRYSAAGAPLGGEFRVNSYTTGYQADPVVGISAAGDFVVAWTSEAQDGSYGGIYAQRYSAAGLPLGSEFRVNTYTTEAQGSPTVAVDADGDFVIAWNSYDRDGSGNGVYAQRFSAGGIPLGGEFRVNTYTTGTQAAPAVGMAAAGNFVITWVSAGQDGSSYGVYAQSYTAAGETVGGEFRVNTYTTGDQVDPAVGIDADGDIVIAWLDSGLSDADVYAQRYNGAGVPLGTEFRVNTYTPDSQYVPAVAMDADGDFVVTWTSRGQDGAGDGVYAQRYTDLDDNGDTAGPTVTSVRPTGASQPIVANGILVSTPSQLTVAFSEAMAVSGAGSVMNPANWQLARYGAVIPGFITGITFGLNAATNQYEAVLSFIAALADGRYTLTALPAMLDAAGNALDGNQNGTPGDAFALTFDVKPVTPRGPETRVNTFTTGTQWFPQVASNAAGDFVVVWGTYDPAGIQEGVNAQRYSAAGAPQGSEFRVNSHTTGFQDFPSVAMSAAGDFVIAWQSAGQDGSGYGVYAQRYSAAGTALGGEFRVNTYTTGRQSNPTVALDAVGNFVIAWRSNEQDGDDFGVYAQRYSAVGVPLGSEFRVNSHTTSAQTDPTVAMNAAGDFAIAWTSYGQDGSAFGVYVQRYSAAGATRGGEFRVNTFTTGRQSGPTVALDAVGNFVIGWVSDQNEQDGSLAGVYAQRFSATGTPQGSEFRVNSYTTLNQNSPTVAMNAAGDFAIAWQSYGQDVSAFGIYAQRYSAAGAPVGGELRVNTYTTNEQQFPNAAMSTAGDFVIVWQSKDQDGSDFGIYAQRYVANLTPTTSGLPNIVIPANPSSNVNLAAGFNDIEDGAAGLTYTVVGNTNPAAFISLVITGSTLTIWPGIPGASTLTIRATDSGGAFVETSFIVTISGPAPQIAQTLVNGFTGAQRSRVTSIELTFTNQVTFAGAVASAFALSRNGGGAVAFTATANIVASVTVVTLNAFTGAETEFGSLRDGRYTLTALASQITVGGLQLDGNGDGSSGDDYTFGDAQGLFRFYGDMNADRRIDISDFGFFSLAYLSTPNYNPVLDFNGDGRIDISDFGQFSLRYFTNLP